MCETPYFLLNRPDILTATETSLQRETICRTMRPAHHEPAIQQFLSMKIDYGDAVSDVLTTVLNSLQFEGKVFCYTKLISPWSLRLKRKDLLLIQTRVWTTVLRVLGNKRPEYVPGGERFT